MTYRKIPSTIKAYDLIKMLHARVLSTYVVHMIDHPYGQMSLAAGKPADETHWIQANHREDRCSGVHFDKVKVISFSEWKMNKIIHQMETFFRPDDDLTFSYWCPDEDMGYDYTVAIEIGANVKSPSGASIMIKSPCISLTYTSGCTVI